MKYFNKDFNVHYKKEKEKKKILCALKKVRSSIQTSFEKQKTKPAGSGPIVLKAEIADLAVSL